MLRVRVVAKEHVAQGICRFELASVDGGDLPAFTSGAHIDVHLPNGLTRQYSLCNAPSERHRYVLGVQLEINSRGGSTGMHLVQAGETLEVSEPRNHFPLEIQAGQTALLVAGGIGITPLLSMAEHLAALKREFRLHYCARSSDRIAFKERLAAPDLAGNVAFHIDDDSNSEIFNVDTITRGVGADTHVFICGPAGFIDAVLVAARKAGVDEARLHREFFSAPPVRGDSGPPIDSAFRVRIASTGLEVRVGENETVVRALTAAGVELPFACEQGVCGTCLTRILEGVPDHRDIFLSDAEHEAGDLFTPCCSRSKSPLLVLDI